MFDNFIVVDTLPVSKEMESHRITKITDFQTKCFDCSLSTYILQGGRLFLKARADGKKPDETAAFVNNERLEEQTHFYGTVNFYDYITRGDLAYWVEYVATFSGGKMNTVKLNNFEVSNIAKRKKEIEKMLEQFRVDAAKWYNRYLFHTTGWRWCKARILSILKFFGDKSC